jgi:hypothetical protein
MSDLLRSVMARVTNIAAVSRADVWSPTRITSRRAAQGLTAGHDAGCVAPMMGAVRYAVLVSIAAAFPALAQTAATPGGITRNGTVILGTGTSVSAVSPATSGTPAAATQATATTTTGGSTTVSAGGAPSTGGASGGGASGGGASGGGASGSRSSTPGISGSPSSSRAASGGSSGSATTAPSSSAPAWVLCPPSGASGMQPFLAGTDLSCAP